MVDVMIDRGFVAIRTDQDGIHTDNATALTDDLDLFVAHVSLDIVKFSRVGMRDNQRLLRQPYDILEPLWIDVREVDDDTKPFAFGNNLAAKGGQTVAGGAAGREDPATAGGVAPGVGQ